MPRYVLKKRTRFVIGGKPLLNVDGKEPRVGDEVECDKKIADRYPTHLQKVKAKAPEKPKPQTSSES